MALGKVQTYNAQALFRLHKDVTAQHMIYLGKPWIFLLLILLRTISFLTIRLLLYATIYS